MVPIPPLLYYFYQIFFKSLRRSFCRQTVTTDVGKRKEATMKPTSKAFKRDRPNWTNWSWGRGCDDSFYLNPPLHGQIWNKWISIKSSFWGWSCCWRWFHQEYQSLCGGGWVLGAAAAAPHLQCSASRVVILRQWRQTPAVLQSYWTKIISALSMIPEWSDQVRRCHE